MIINGASLKNSISKLDSDNDQGELYLNIFQIIRGDGEKILTFQSLMKRKFME